MIEKINLDVLESVLDCEEEHDLGDGYTIRFVALSDRIWDIGVELCRDEEDWDCDEEDWDCDEEELMFLFDYYANNYSELIESGGVFESMVNDINQKIDELNQAREAA